MMTSFNCKTISAILLSTFSLVASAQSGLDERKPNNEFLLDVLPPEARSQVALTPIFGDLRFEQLTFVAPVPDGSRDYVVTERPGRIFRFPETATSNDDRQLFLDISDVTELISIEQGLLSITFSPDFATDHSFFINYTSPERTLTISRFLVDPNTGLALRESETKLLQIQTPFSEHNGGNIRFDNQKMMYISTGDGGSFGDPNNNSQNTTTLMGKMLRIDVFGEPDPGLNYRIPRDNPFYNGGPAGDETRKEIYAYGLRNPFRFNIDTVTQQIFLGDVGQQLWEEINIIRRGANYGWRLREGKHCYNPTTDCPTEGLTDPIFEYSHSVGGSVTGGTIYRGSAIPALYGSYIFGDLTANSLWSMRYEDGLVTGPDPLALATGINVVCIEPDHDGELIVPNFDFNPDKSRLYRITQKPEESLATKLDDYTDFLTGKSSLPPVLRNDDGVLDVADVIWRRNNGDAESVFPAKVSDFPIFEEIARGIDNTHRGVYAYEPSAKLWSDGALKERFFALPGLTQMEYRETGGFEMPEGSLLVKNFLLPLDDRDPEGTAKRVETRLLMKTDGQWFGFSYAWDDDETDATLVGADGLDREFTIINKDGLEESYSWHYPTRTECMQCHTPASNFALGVTAAQLNYDLTYEPTGRTANQLATFESIGLFKDPLPDTLENLPKMPATEDMSAPVSERARAYLAANCAGCHLPGGPTPVNLDFRWHVTSARTGAMDVETSGPSFGIEDARIINVGHSEHSILSMRMGRRDSTQMPPLGTSRIDNDAVALIQEWIDELDTPVTDPMIGLKDAGAANWEVLADIPEIFFSAPSIETNRGLGLFRNDQWQQQFALWRPKELMDPLPSGKYRIEMEIEYDGKIDWSYYSEARLRLYSQNSEGIAQTQSLVTFLHEEGTTIPNQLVGYLESNGTDQWGASMELMSYTFLKQGGARIIAFDIDKLDDEVQLSNNAPIITSPVIFETNVSRQPTIRWSSPKFVDPARITTYRVYRELLHEEIETPTHRRRQELLLGSTTATELTLSEELLPNRTYAIRVESIVDGTAETTGRTVFRTGN